MIHKNFYIFQAENNFDLGIKMGRKFANIAQGKIREKKKNKSWDDIKGKSIKYLGVTKKYFPNYIKEMKGYAKGAKVNFLDLWTISLENEPEGTPTDKCITIITDSNCVMAHNEEWIRGQENDVCLILKKIGKLKILEIYYFNTLGGNAVSINSHGFIASVNSLSHSRQKIGVPRNVICRWLSETKNPEKDMKIFKKMPKGLGCNYNILNLKGDFWNLEYTSEKMVFKKARSPFVHANFYLSRLGKFDTDKIKNSSARHKKATEETKEAKTENELKKLMSSFSADLYDHSIGERTVGKIIIDTRKLTAEIWLKRERNKGWISYDLEKYLFNN